MAHNERFAKLVNEARKTVPEIQPEEALRLVSEKDAVLIDVREGEDWDNGHAAGAVHLSKGIIELEIEDVVPDVERPIICYCGGGSRSLLAGENLKRMGYKNVFSLAGGFRGWKGNGRPVE